MTDRCEYGYRHLEGDCVYCERDKFRAENHAKNKRVRDLWRQLRSATFASKPAKDGKIEIGVPDALTIAELDSLLGYEAPLAVASFQQLEAENKRIKTLVAQLRAWMIQGLERETYPRVALGYEECLEHLDELFPEGAAAAHENLDD